MIDIEKYPWLKSKGYLHLTPKIDVNKRATELISKVTSPQYVQHYAFFPLIHSIIAERRYKKDPATGRRSHTKIKDGKVKSNAKKRPLHYASNMDALVFGYYSTLISQAYEEKLKAIPNLTECVVAYRRIPILGSDKNKGTIHFANEVFEEIIKRSKSGCAVLKFDIKSFFSEIDHDYLKSKWINVIGQNDKLPDDHFNVFKAATKFSFVFKDDFRINSYKQYGKRRTGFDEKRLAEIRNKYGKHCLFQSTKELRDAIRNRDLRVYKNSFRNKDGKSIGIPQGLPISSVLANLYLIDFDINILRKVSATDGFYRRYSDDIIIVCSRENSQEMIDFVSSEIKNSRVEMSEDKTQQFIFNLHTEPDGTSSLKSSEIIGGNANSSIPFTYLGFEFYGDRASIKSANLAKFYRRMINTVKRKVKRAIVISRNNLGKNPVIFRQQLMRIYTLPSLTSTKYLTRSNWIARNEKGEYFIKSKQRPQQKKGNYLTYVSKAAIILKDEMIEKQISKHKRILNKAIRKHFAKQITRFSNNTSAI